MSGWLLIFVLLILGGVLSTFGDLLGTKVGKARLSIFRLRPRRTAILITIFTGSFISALSLALIFAAPTEVSRQLKVGLFELDDLQYQLKESRMALAPLKEQSKLLEERISQRKKDLSILENEIIALRNGKVVISSGEVLMTAKIRSDSSIDKKDIIQSILWQANNNAIDKVQPKDKKISKVLVVRKDHVNTLEEKIKENGELIVLIRSAGNVLLGEDLVYAFPEIISNKKIVDKGEVIEEISFNTSLGQDEIKQKIKLLLVSTLAEVKSRGSLANDINIDPNSMNLLSKQLQSRSNEEIKLQSISTRFSDRGDVIVVGLKID